MQATLEHMTIWGLISDASLLVKAVMLTLLLASLLSWYLIIQRSTVLRRTERQFKGFMQRFRSTSDLPALLRETAQVREEEGGVEPIFHAGFQAFTQLNVPSGSPQVVLEGVERSLQVAISEQEVQLEKGLQFLATVGSVSPYIGLFGTVWGIMNAFLGLSQVQQASLSTVAPGIAEALIATAIGLFAAIPAVIAYNRYADQVSRMELRYDTFVEELSSILQRHATTPRSNVAHGAAEARV